ncbi:MAG: ABC transporter permease [Burkholderiales bacterium]
MKIPACIPVARGARHCLTGHFGPTSRKLSLAAAMLGLILASVVMPAQAQRHSSAPSICGDLTNGFGPFDYRKVRDDRLNMVERVHFTPIVEALIKGATTSGPGGDIDYTLRAFPNHHRALLAVMSLGEKLKMDKVVGMTYPIECYFDRAVRFARDDAIARMIYATYLGHQGRIADAKAQLRAAEVAPENSAITFYNIGMVYADLKDYDRALAQAHKAASMGFSQPALKARLEQAGKWRDLPAASGSTAKAPD